MTVHDDIALARLTLPETTATGVDVPARPRALLLQGPVGPFMGTLRRQLGLRGFDVRQVAFNLADLLYAGRVAPGDGVCVYRGHEERWEAWLQALMADWRPDVIVLFGCERARHSAARSLAKRYGIPVLSLEEGYVRPGFVSAEWGGNNRCSPLATLPDATIASLAQQPAPSPTRDREFNAMAWWGFLYYVVRTLGVPVFPRAVHHKRRPLVSETAYWLRSAWRKATRYLRNRDLVDALVEHERGRFFVVPLQVRDDMQIEKASRGWTNERLIEDGIASFARHASVTHRLVFKVHPLERGHSRAFAHVRAAAARHGIADRVDIVDDGSIGLLVSASAGMLTINSTSAFSALLREVPLGVLGDALYRREGLATPIATNADLDRFWTDAKPADRETTETFRRAVVATALLPGDFYRKQNRALVADEIVDRIEAGLVVAQERQQERLRAEASHLRAEPRSNDTARSRKSRRRTGRTARRAER